LVKEKHGGVSFVELQDIPGFKGDYEWFLEPFMLSCGKGTVKTPLIAGVILIGMMCVIAMS
jgi:hypothetical protein